MTTLQQIGVCIIHFETAFEALFPERRRIFRAADGVGGLCESGNSDAESNWLASPFLAQLNKGRLASMKTICEASSMNEVIRLLNGARYGHEALIPRNYAWNFKSILRSRRAIEFRKPPAAVDASSALQWAELMLSFIGRCLLVPYPAWSSVTYAATTEGLYQFLELVLVIHAQVAGAGRPDLLQKLWEGKWASSAQPVPCLRGTEVSPVIEARLTSLIEADRMQNSPIRRL